MNEIDDMEDNFGPTPGPGQYTGIYTNSSFTTEKKTRFQRMEVGNARW